MIQELFNNSFIVSTRKLTIQRFKNWMCKKNGYYITVFNEALVSQIKKNDLYINFDTMQIMSKEKNQYGLRIDGNVLLLSNNEMNTRDLYYIYDKNANLFIIFNNLLLAKEILLKSGLSLEYDYNKIYENGSYFKHIQLLEHSEVITINNQNGTITLTKTKLEDVLIQIKVNNLYTIEAVNQKLLNILIETTEILTRNYDNVSILLSGGLDSATIAYILKKLNKNVTAYTVGTEWDNEYEDAAKIAKYININLNKIFLSKEEMLREIPYIIAFLGFNNDENIEISLVPQCLFRKISELYPDRKILFATGFGADLINAGIYHEFNDYDALKEQLIQVLYKTRMSNELYSNLFFNNNSYFPNINVVHPFWNIEVIKESLRIPTEFKIQNNIGKYFFRKMMEEHLGKENAWRSKQAIHQGTGISANLKTIILDKNEILQNDDYKLYYKDLHKKLFFENDFSLLK
ncbi:MAG: asparagine synthase-related protein [bacterium]